MAWDFFYIWLDSSSQSDLAWPKFDKIPQRPHSRAFLVPWRMSVDRGATCCCWSRQIQVYSHSYMDFNEITLNRLKRRWYGPASVSDVNTRWRSWFEGFNFRRNRTGMCIKTRPSKIFAVPIFFSYLSAACFPAWKLARWFAVCSQLPHPWMA